MALPGPLRGRSPPAGARLALVLAAAALAAGCLGVAASEEAPPFEVATAEGGTWNLTEHRGSPVVLDFMATTCAPCNDQTREVAAARSNATDAAVVSLSFDPGDNASALRDWKARHDADWPHATAPEVAAEYEVVTIPTIVVVAPDGHVAWTSSGREVVDASTLSHHLDEAAG